MDNFKTQKYFHLKTYRTDNTKEILREFKTGRTSIKFSGKIRLTIILKFTKKQSFTLSLEDTFLEKLQEDSNWTPSSVLRVKVATA